MHIKKGLREIAVAGEATRHGAIKNVADRLANQKLETAMAALWRIVGDRRNESSTPSTFEQLDRFWNGWIQDLRFSKWCSVRWQSFWENCGDKLQVTGTRISINLSNHEWKGLINDIANQYLRQKRQADPVVQPSTVTQNPLDNVTHAMLRQRNAAWWQNQDAGAGGNWNATRTPNTWNQDAGNRGGSYQRGDLSVSTMI